jgi:hypothetical protein
LRLIKERGYEDAKAFLGACGKDYSNLLKMLRGDTNMNLKSLEFLARSMGLYPYITMIPRSYVSEKNFKLLLEQYGLFYSVKEGVEPYLLTDVVEGLNKDGKLDALSNFPLLAVQEVLVDAQIHGHLGEALEMLLDTIKKINEINHPNSNPNPKSGLICNR